MLCMILHKNLANVSPRTDRTTGKNWIGAITWLMHGIGTYYTLPYLTSMLSHDAMQEVLTWQQYNYRVSSEDVCKVASEPGLGCLQTIFDEYRYKLVGGLDNVPLVSDEKSDSEEEDPDALREFLQEVGARFNDNAAAAELPSREEADCQSGLEPVDVSSLTGATRDSPFLCGTLFFVYNH